MSGMVMFGGMSGREMMDGPTVGPDATAFVVRRAPSAAIPGMMQPQTATPAHELVAVNPRDGSAKWKLQITGAMISEPALAQDGRIFLTSSEFPGLALSRLGGMMTPGGPASAGKARLIVVTTTAVSARISNTVEVDSDMLSAPRVATDETGSYVVYVTGFEMGGMRDYLIGDSDSTPAGEKTLYAFNPDGQLRFKLKLNEAPAR
jgi:outer membrane protein assembly factor BamB